MITKWLRATSVLGSLFVVALATAQSEIRTGPGGKRLLCIDPDGQSIRKEPSGPRVLFVDGDDIRPEPGGVRLLFVDGDDVRPEPGGIRLAFIDGDDVRRNPGGPVLFNYKHPDLAPSFGAKSEYFVDGKELTKPQLVAVLHLLKPDMFKLSKEREEELKKEMKANGEAEEKRLAADRAVGKFDILTANGAPASSGRITSVKSGNVYQLKFEHKDGPVWTGTGVHYKQKDHDQYLVLGFGTTNTVGLAEYEIKGGNLEGKWYNGFTDGDAKNTGSENLKGPESLDGEFTIVAAKAPKSGAEYTGKVTIKPLDINVDGGFKVYSVTWTIGTATIQGIGLRSEDNRLYVASGGGEAFNVAAFKLDTDGTMIGDFVNGKKEKGFYTTSKVNE